MGRFIHAIQTFAEGLGAPGLFLMAALDSSFIPFPGINDGLVILFSAQHPTLWWYFALLSASGSLAGSYVLYQLGRSGGHAFLARKLKARHIERTMAQFQKYDLLAIIVPAILPPPFPLKPFVLLAGVVGVRPVAFVLALGSARLFRFGGEALLASHYGASAGAFIQQNLARASIGLAIAVALGVLVVYVRRRRQK